MAYAKHVYAAVECEPPREYRVQSAVVLPTDTPSWLLFDELKVGNRVVVVFTIIGFNGSHNVENKHNEVTDTPDC